MSKHIMVINDTEEILDLFYQILHGEGGYEVTLSSFQPQMIDQIKKVGPDLIISDHVFGEEKVGWQFLQRLKMDRETAEIPVIICSGAVKELREIEGYLVSKGVGVLFKPFDIDDLLELVAKKLNEGNVTPLAASEPYGPDDTHTSGNGSGAKKKSPEDGK